MKYGLSDSVINEILSVISKHPEIHKVIIFGSRAKGNFTSGSDIDLAVEASDLSYDEFVKIQTELDQLELIYKIDFIDYTKIVEPALKNHIDRVGKIIYQSDKTIIPGAKNN